MQAVKLEHNIKYGDWPACFRFFVGYQRVKLSVKQQSPAPFLRLPLDENLFELCHEPTCMIYCTSGRHSCRKMKRELAASASLLALAHMLLLPNTHDSFYNSPRDMLLWMNEVQAVKTHVGLVLSFHNSIIGASPVVTLRSHRAPGGRFRQDAQRFLLSLSAAGDRFKQIPPLFPT